MLIIESFGIFWNSTYNRDSAYNRVVRVNAKLAVLANFFACLSSPLSFVKHKLVCLFQQIPSIRKESMCPFVRDLTLSLRLVGT